MTDETNHHSLAEGTPPPDALSPLARNIVAAVVSVIAVVGVVYFVAWLSADRLNVYDDVSAAEQGPPAELQWPPKAKPVSEVATRPTPGFRFATMPGSWRVVRDAFVRQIRKQKWRIVTKKHGEKPGVTLVVEKRGWHSIIGILEGPSGRDCTVSIHRVRTGQPGAAGEHETEGK